MPLTHSGIIRGLVVVAALGATPIEQSKSQSPVGVVPPVGLDSLCVGTDNSYVCAQAIEKHQLAKPEIARVATRTPTGLRLRLLDGKGRTVLVREEPDSSHRFSFRENLTGPGYFLLHRQLHEWTDYVLINARSGKRFTLQERPVVSPDGSRLVTALAGLSGMSAGNAVQVWRIKPSGLELEFELAPKDWEPSDPKWLDRNIIQLRQQAPLFGDTRAFSNSVDLVRLQGKWSLQKPRAQPTTPAQEGFPPALIGISNMGQSGVGVCVYDYARAENPLNCWQIEGGKIFTWNRGQDTFDFNIRVFGSGLPPALLCERNKIGNVYQVRISPAENKQDKTCTITPWNPPKP